MLSNSSKNVSENKSNIERETNSNKAQNEKGSEKNPHNCSKGETIRNKINTQKQRKSTEAQSKEEQRKAAIIKTLITTKSDTHINTTSISKALMPPPLARERKMELSKEISKKQNETNTDLQTQPTIETGWVSIDSSDESERESSSILSDDEDDICGKKFSIKKTSGKRSSKMRLPKKKLSLKDDTASYSIDKKKHIHAVNKGLLDTLPLIRTQCKRLKPPPSPLLSVSTPQPYTQEVTLSMKDRIRISIGAFNTECIRLSKKSKVPDDKIAESLLHSVTMCEDIDRNSRKPMLGACIKGKVNNTDTDAECFVIDIEGHVLSPNFSVKEL